MIGKITLTEDQAKAIEAGLKYSKGDKAQLLNDHASGGKWSSHKTVALNDLTQSDMARALLIGYEVEVNYKAGDWILWDNRIYCKVIRVCENSVDTDYVGSNGYKQNFCLSRIRRATPEEIKAEKERLLFEKLGRKVGEFKAGDFAWESNGVYHTYDAEIMRGWYKNGRMKGFYPAESFVRIEE